MPTNTIDSPARVRVPVLFDLLEARGAPLDRDHFFFTIPQLLVDDAPQHYPHRHGHLLQNVIYSALRPGGSSRGTSHSAVSTSHGSARCQLSYFAFGFASGVLVTCYSSSELNGRGAHTRAPGTNAKHNHGYSMPTSVGILEKGRRIRKLQHIQCWTRFRCMPDMWGRLTPQPTGRQYFPLL